MVSSRSAERKSWKPSGLAVGLREGLGVAQRRARRVGEIEAGVGLEDEHDRRRAAGLGLRDGLVQPGDVGLVAGGVLGRVGRDVAEVVARAPDVEGRVGHAAHGPASKLV